MLDASEIQKLLPHRYPFLLVDRVLEIEKDKKIVGLKNVSMNEPFFAGHFPDYPVMPGVLIIEAMAQTGGILASYSIGGNKGNIPFFTGIERAKFRNPVFPGDQLRFELIVLKKRGSLWCFNAKACVGEKIAAEAEIRAMLIDEGKRK